MERDLSEFMAGHKGPPCSVPVALALLEPEDREWIDELLAHPKTVSTKIAKELSRLTGEKIAGPTLQRHRRGDCSCA